MGKLWELADEQKREFNEMYKDINAEYNERNENLAELTDGIKGGRC